MEIHSIGIPKREIMFNLINKLITKIPFWFQVLDAKRMWHELFTLVVNHELCLEQRSMSIKKIPKLVSKYNKTIFDSYIHERQWLVIRTISTKAFQCAEVVFNLKNKILFNMMTVIWSINKAYIILFAVFTLFSGSSNGFVKNSRHYIRHCRSKPFNQTIVFLGICTNYFVASEQRKSEW